MITVSKGEEWGLNEEVLKDLELGKVSKEGMFQLDLVLDLESIEVSGKLKQGRIETVKAGQALRKIAEDRRKLRMAWHV